jgi:DNA-binding CsgD family transcriptional regulator
MPRLQQVFLDYCDALYAAKDIDTMFSGLEKAVQAMGFDNVSYTYVPGAIGQSLHQLAPIFKLSSAYNTQFIQHYSDARFGNHDFTIKRIMGGDLTPMIWWREADAKRLSKSELEVIEVARQDYGIHQGISLPTFTDGRSIAGVSITREEKDLAFEQLYEEKGSYLRKMSMMFSNRVLCMEEARVIFMIPIVQSLSLTEKQVLCELAKGRNLKSVCLELDLDYKYVANSVIKSLRKKFGNVTRDALMYEAGLLNIVRLLDKETASNKSTPT